MQKLLRVISVLLITSLVTSPPAFSGGGFSNSGGSSGGGGALDLTSWNLSASSPLLNAGGGNQLRDVIKVGSTYYMFEEGAGGGGATWGIYYRTSSDGLSWSSSTGPVMSKGASGDWDGNGQADPTVVYVGPGDWRMWFDGLNNVSGLWEGIGYATSADGATWTKHTTASVATKVINLGANGTWDDVFLHHPSCLLYNGTYYLFYSAHNGDGRWNIGVATSSTGTPGTFTKYAGNPIITTGGSGTFDYLTLRLSRPFLVGSTWYMTYWGANLANEGTIGLASSPDLFNWTKLGQVIPAGGATDWNFEKQANSVIAENGTYRMWYSGGLGGTYNVGTAVPNFAETATDIPDGAIPFGDSDELVYNPLDIFWNNTLKTLGISNRNPVAKIDIKTGGSYLTSISELGLKVTALASKTFNTTSGALTHTLVNFTNSAARVSGANALTNVALTLTASGGQANYALLVPAGLVGLGATADTPVSNLDISTSISDPNKARMMTKSSSTGDIAGWGFGVSGAAGADVKGSFAFIRTTSSGRGDFTWLLDNTADTSVPTIADQRMRLFLTRGHIVTPPATQTIASGNTITDNGCNTIKPISSAGAVTTDTTNTFTAPTSTTDGTNNAGCRMTVVNVGANNITLDNNALFKSAGGADVVMTPDDVVEVFSTGSVWYQATPLQAN